MARMVLVWLLAIALACAGCGSRSAAPTAAVEVYPGAEWSYAERPTDLGWSTEKLELARKYAESIGSAAVMVVDDGVVVAAWGDIERKYHCHSMRKSLMSALCGIYEAEGKIDLNATLGELGIDDKTPLTEIEKTAQVRDLLAARSGVYLEAAGEAEMMKLMRPRRGSHAPGSFWYYNNWDFNALGTIFDRLSGETDIYQAFQKRIAGRIRMQDYDPTELHYSYEPYSVHPYYGFRLSARDAARFGLLFLRNGLWKGQQIVPADWVKESTSAVSVIGPGSGYGYMWWLGEGQGGFPNVNEGAGSFYASGAYGQEIIVMPARDLVVVHRVNSDAGMSVSEDTIGTLLWLILDAAGEKDIGPPVVLERATGSRLSGEAIGQALRGKTLSAWQSQMQIKLSFDLAQGVTLELVGLQRVAGTWWTDGEHYCQDLGKEYGRPECCTLVVDDSSVRQFDLQGFLRRELVMQESAEPGVPLTAEQRRVLFEQVWHLVDQTFPDATFGGLDWATLGNEFLPRAMAAEDDEAFFATVNQMLWKLGRSHLVVGPLGDATSAVPQVWAAGDTGLELRLLDGQVVITRVTAGSAAEKAGLRPGFVVQSIDGQAAGEILARADARWIPPYNEQGKLENRVRELMARLFGEPGTSVCLSYLDGSDRLVEACLVRTPRTRSVTTAGMPPTYLEFESRRLAGKIGYIRFNTFHADILPDLLAALQSMQDTVGLVLDLRGNPGGDAGAGEKGAAMFLDGQFKLGQFQGQQGTVSWDVSGTNAYGGPLVILMDHCSASASEAVASGLQAVGRARVIGERSPGAVSSSKMELLSDEVMLMYPFVFLQTPDGQMVEGRGVVPDVVVSLEREELLAGVDTQLEAAVANLLQSGH